MTASPFLGTPNLALGFDVSSLRIWQEWRVIPGAYIGSVGAAWGGHAFARELPHGFGAAGGQAAVWRNLGSATAVFRIVDALQVVDFQPLAGAAGTREAFYVFAPNTAAPFPVDWFPTWFPTTESANMEPSLSVEVMAWVRKKLAGDAPGARQFFGIINQGDANFSRRNARIGLAGDALGGFRFQSNNCPGAPAGGVENGQADVDANSVQPAALVAPGANWSHIRIKAIPATASKSGRFLGFLNGQLVAIFDQAVNFPQASRNAADGLQDQFWPIQPCIALWGDPDGVTADKGLYMRDIRVRLVENWDNE